MDETAKFHHSAQFSAICYGICENRHKREIHTGRAVNRAQWVNVIDNRLFWCIIYKQTKKGLTTVWGCRMYHIKYYRDQNGKSSVEEYLSELASRTDKDSRVKLNKIQEYMKVLRERGTRAGQPYVKHLDGEIWELRPIRDRVLFAAWYGDSFVLLHTFLKQTQKTPRREIEQAKRELADLRERMKKL